MITLVKRFMVLGIVGIFFNGGILASDQLVQSFDDVDITQKGKPKLSEKELQNIMAIVDKAFPKESILSKCGDNAANFAKNVVELFVSGALGVGLTSLIMSAYIDQKYNERGIWEEVKQGFLRGGDATGEKGIIFLQSIGCLIISTIVSFVLIKMIEKGLTPSSKSNDELRQEMFTKLLNQSICGKGV